MTILSAASTRHVARLFKAGGVAAVYRRGSAEITKGTDGEDLKAVPGSSAFEESTGPSESIVESKTYDWLFKTADLVMAGQAVTPVRGDQVVLPSGDVFDVVPASNSAPANFNDGRETMTRVHTVKRVKG